MKKAVISNRIYISVTPELKEELDRELTYSIPSYMPTEPPTIIKNMAVVRDNIVSIPSGRLDLVPEDYELVDKRLEVPVEFPEFRHTLRPAQKEVYDDIDQSCMINAWVSWGKTFTALAIAGKLGQKTLVVTHTVDLRDQWAVEVEKVFGIKAGIIGSGRFETDSPIVIGNVQTLFKCTQKISKMFGTVIVDECHHTSAPTFSKIVHASYARYKIGLSGTISRKDGKHVLFKDYFSEKLYQPPKENYVEPKVLIYDCPIRFADGKQPWANKVSALCNNQEYRQLISMLALGLSKKGHKILVVADRVEFLRACAELTGDRAICVTGKHVSGTDSTRKEEIKKLYTEDKSILYGTRSIFAEGISVNILSCLILATPINNEPLLTQLIGRVIREYEGKMQPLIVDVNLKGNTVQRQAKGRFGYYMREGYDISYL